VTPRTPLWLSHHWPEEYDRCVRIGDTHVCRRCVWFYSACFLTLGLDLAGIHWPNRLDPWVLWLASLPVVVEWWAEHMGWVRYSARRQVVTALIVGPAVGRGLGRYLNDHTDPLFWSVVLTFAVVCAIPFFLSRRRPDASGRPGHAAELERVDQ
jgi:hypothetical protein